MRAPSRTMRAPISPSGQALTDMVTTIPSHSKNYSPPPKCTPCLRLQRPSHDVCSCDEVFEPALSGIAVRQPPGLASHSGSEMHTSWTSHHFAAPNAPPEGPAPGCPKECPKASGRGPNCLHPVLQVCAPDPQNGATVRTGSRSIPSWIRLTHCCARAQEE